MTRKKASEALKATLGDRQAITLNYFGDAKILLSLL